MAYGDYEQFFPSGIVRGRDLSRVERVDPAKITESVTHSWYEYSGEDEALHPHKGQTNPKYTGPDPPYDWLDTNEKYSWLKSPRYDGVPMEVGPLARVLVAYGSGDETFRGLVDRTLGQLGLERDALFSTLGRIVARALETAALVDSMEGWVDALAHNMDKRDLRIADNEKWDPATWPSDCTGAGFHEAPRGALGHWVHIQKGKILNYQCVVPSTWNAGPRDGSGRRGPYEQALLGTPVADPTQPLEILRTLHSFDPCMACGVHVVDASRRELAHVTVR
jgi:Ni,Fe-hydrogenase I large subunit